MNKANTAQGRGEHDALMYVGGAQLTQEAKEATFKPSMHNTGSSGAADEVPHSRTELSQHTSAIASGKDPSPVTVSQQSEPVVVPGSESISLEGCDQGPCSGPRYSDGGGGGSKGYGLGEDI